MFTSRRFAPGSAELARKIGVVLGVALGLVTSRASAQRAITMPDLVLEDEIQTGSVCGGAAMRCFAHVHTTDDGVVQAAVAPAGFGASDLQAAYNIPATIMGTPTIAIVDAYGYTTLEADLAMYRTQYGLPACTIANGCLKIVNQNGAATPLPAQPPTNDDWTLETALDVDMASAGCPTCKILVVEANDDSGSGLDTSQNTAATLGATVISNSWGGPEQAGQSLDGLEVNFDHPNIAIFVSAGDAGYNDAGQGPDYPATSSHVIAVGGTHLVKDASTRGWIETAWTRGGSACSLSITKPAYQTNSGCQFKATTDIAAVGDPQTGVAVYNSRNGGWTVVGGTSASAPLIAAIFAATGNGNQTSGEFVKSNAAKLYDVTSGTNGTCANAILCHAGTGWDGPTGYGTPNAALLVTGRGSGSTGSDTTGDSGGASDSDNGSGSESDDVTGGCSTTNPGGLVSLLLIGFAITRCARVRG